MMIIRLPRLYCLALCFTLISVWNPAQATTILAPQQAHDGIVAAPMTFFDDNSGANSVAQAMAQYNRLKPTPQGNPAALISLGRDGVPYWLVLNLQNTSKVEKWWLHFNTAQSNAISPIKAMTVYDAATGNIITRWPDVENKAALPSIPLNIKTGESVTRFIMVELWPGVTSPLQPVLETQAHKEQSATIQAYKLGLLWLVIGAALGAGLMQLVLTHQLVQGLLAVNAVLIGIGSFILYRSDFLPLMIDGHPILAPLVMAVLYGISASAILWTTTSRYGVKSSICMIPILLNLIVCGVALFNLDLLSIPLFGLEKLPVFTLTLTGAILMVMTAFLGFADMNILWLMPAWLALSVMPWLSQDSQYICNAVYLVMLGVVGVASVFWYWKQMDDETRTLQQRLRLEMGNIKSRYKKENEDWNKKMETQRALLNELRSREQQRSSELEVATKEAEAANKAKSDFLAIISHEIRTPMNGIMGIVQIINQTPLDEKQSDYIDVIKNSGETMLTLLNDILDYSKIEKGMIDLEYIPFSLPKLVKSVVMLMSGRAADKGVDIHIDIQPDISDSRQGDPSRIRQILLNLVGNAIKFTERGSVTIRVSRRDDARNPPHLYFEIIDTGMGISAEAQQKLFQAYAQADASISRRFGGTGLGLNICRMLTQAMDGTIGVTSVEGQGSTFWFELPLPAIEVLQTEARPEMIVHRPADQRALSIMVIDDNAVNLKIVSGLLEMDGHTITIINSAERGLAIIEEHEPFDLIFVDIIMPEMDGKTFLAHLQRHPDPSRSSMPVFALTGMADQATINELIALGMRGVITKPIVHATLRDAVRSIDGSASPLKIENLVESIEHMPEAEKDKLRQALGVSGTMEIPQIDESLLNMAMLADLKTSLPPETLQDIFVELIDKAIELTDAIEVANGENDFKTLGAKAHDLRGMAGNFGLQGLMEHSALIENSIRDGANGKAASLAQESRLMLDNSLSALNAWLES